MSYQDFVSNPWRNSAPAYDGHAFFQHFPSPEYATGEVILASLYRAAGFKNYSEKGVPAAGREFSKRMQSTKAHTASGSNVAIAEWNLVTEGILESPKQANQSQRRFLQMCPIVPDVALYSGAARTTGNPWTPGTLIQTIIEMGSESSEAAADLWCQLGNALGVDSNDDVWARWLDEEFRRRSDGPSWQVTKLQDGSNLSPIDKPFLNFPAKQFCLDLQSVLKAKDLMTRRQWVSLVESVVRIGSVAHVLWLSDVNGNIWRVIKEVLKGGTPPDLSMVRNDVVSLKTHFLSYGYPAMPEIRGYISRYLVARMGINAVLWKLAELDLHPPKNLEDCQAVKDLLEKVQAAREALCGSGVLSDVLRLQDEHAKVIACKKGLGANLVEFCRYVLGQRQTADEALRGYDQGYLLRKKGEHKSAQFIVSLGPVAVLAMVHCCLQRSAGPRSIQTLCRHMQNYGIKLQIDDVINGDLGRKLRTLGLVLDSPDAESGMLLVVPFN